MILNYAGITGLFDAHVEGIDLNRLALRGKPAPDMFIEASRQLDSEPQCTVGVEDALMGVQAAQIAGLGCVIGVNRDDQA